MSGFGSSPGYSGSSGYHGTGGNGGHGNSYTGNANKDPGYSHPMGRSIGFNHGTRNLNNAARAENRSPKEEKPYPIHSRIQVTINMLQKLHAMSADFAQNQKNMDYSDADFRMLPLRTVAIAASYSFVLKLAALMLFLASCLMAYFGIPVYFLLVLAIPAFWIAFNFPSMIIRNALQYVTGPKTSRFYKRILVGWRVFEGLFIFLAVFSIGLYFLNGVSFIKELVEKAISFKYVAKLNITPEIIQACFTNFMFLMVGLLIVHFALNMYSSKKAKKLQNENLKNMMTETRREEVADKLLDGSL